MLLQQLIHLTTQQAGIQQMTASSHNCIAHDQNCCNSPERCLKCRCVTGNNMMLHNFLTYFKQRKSET